MKIKLLIALFSAILLAFFLLIDSKATDNSAAEKWASFGMGMVSVIFVSSSLSAINIYRKKNRNKLT